MIVAIVCSEFKIPDSELTLQRGDTTTRTGNSQRPSLEFKVVYKIADTEIFTVRICMQVTLETFTKTPSS